MAEVDGIETASEQTYAHRCGFSPWKCPPRLAAYLTVAMDHVLVRRQFVQSHRSSRVEPVGRNSGLCAGTELKAVGKAGRRVHVDGSGINLAFKALSRSDVAGNDGIGQMGPVAFDKSDRFLDGIDHFYRQ